MTSRTEHNDPESIGGFALTYHYEMLSDVRRVTPFARAIADLCRGKIVFESGTGSGVLSILAARAGAKAVFCSEIDPSVAEFAKSNIAASGFSNVVTLLQKSTLDITLQDLGGVRPDVVMAENLSTWQVTEPQNQVMNHIRKNLAHPQTISIPEYASNYVQLGQSEYRFFDTVELRTPYYEFQGIRGAIQRSLPTLFSTFNYKAQTDTAIEKEIVVKAYSSGIVNSLRLTSPLKISEGNHFEISDSLMPAVVVPLSKDMEVSAGEDLLVSIRYQTCASWQEMECDIRRA